MESDTVALTLEPTPVYEQTKQAMGFDPQAPAPDFGELEPWLLQQDYPETVMARIKDLADRLGYTPDDLQREWAWMSWQATHKEGEQEDADTSSQQASQAAEHLGLASGGQASGDSAGVAEPQGEVRDSEGGQDGAPVPVSSRRDAPPDPGGEHPGGGAEAVG